MQDKFYTLKPAVDTEETGNVFPAVESYEDYDFNAPNSVHKLNHHEFPDFTPEIKFKLVKGAKLCDVMGQATISSSGLLVSKRFKESVENLNIAPYKFFSATIEDNGTFHQYYWFHIVWKEIEDLIDYQNSVFYKKRGPRNMGELNIKSKNDYWAQKKEIGSRFLIGFEKIKLINTPMYNLFVMPYRGHLVCNSIIEEFVTNKNQFTGIKLTPCSELEVLQSQT